MPLDALPYDGSIYRIRKTVDTPDERLVYGWASVIARNGQPTFDTQDDLIPEYELHRAAHGYVMKARSGSIMHHGVHVADAVESFLVTRNSSFSSLLQSFATEQPDSVWGDVMKNMEGRPLPFEGWWTGFKVLHDPVWQMVKSGELKSFSIGGTGTRSSFS